MELRIVLTARGLDLLSYPAAFDTIRRILLLGYMQHHLLFQGSCDAPGLSSHNLEIAYCSATYACGAACGVAYIIARSCCCADAYDGRCAAAVLYRC